MTTESLYLNPDVTQATKILSYDKGNSYNDRSQQFGNITLMAIMAGNHYSLNRNLIICGPWNLWPVSYLDSGLHGPIVSECLSSLGATARLLSIKRGMIHSHDSHQSNVPKLSLLWGKTLKTMNRFEDFKTSFFKFYISNFVTFWKSPVALSRCIYKLIKFIVRETMNYLWTYSRFRIYGPRLSHQKLAI